jgi:hypothetical protein
VKRILLAIARPEQFVVGSHRRYFAQPDSTVGIETFGQTTAVFDQVKEVPPAYVSSFVDALYKPAKAAAGT